VLILLQFVVLQFVRLQIVLLQMTKIFPHFIQWTAALFGQHYGKDSEVISCKEIL